MAAHSLLVVSAFLLWQFQTGCCQDIAGPTQITINPPSLVMSPNVSDTTGGQVTVTCRPSSAGAEPLVAMAIERVLHTNPNAAPVSLAAASLTQNNGDPALTLQSLDASVSGSVSQRIITLTLNSAKCGDGGMYICEAITFTSATKIYSSSANMSVQVSPGEILMTADPSGTTNWQVNQTLLMRCNGIVGTVNDDSQIEWMWEYQDSTLGYDNWQSYSSIGNPDTDINNQGITGSSNCYKYQISELTRHLTLDDTGRQYRCYVINRDVTSNSVDFAQIHDVGTVTESGIPFGPQNPSTRDDTTSGPQDPCAENGKETGDKQATCRCPDAGVIIGATVAVIIVIDVIILAVVIILFRRRLQEAAESMRQAAGGIEHSMSVAVNGKAEDRGCPVNHSSVSMAASSNPYDSLNAGDIGIASVYQDFGSPYEMPR